MLKYIIEVGVTKMRSVLEGIIQWNLALNNKNCEGTQIYPSRTREDFNRLLSDKLERTRPDLSH